MYHVQFHMPSGEHEMVEVKVPNRTLLAHSLSKSKYPIAAVFEGPTVITKAIKPEVAKWPSLSRHARDFVNSRP